ncbi:MAG: hypothetical protein BWY72_02091 [Bacteroidetes bacterium ADurb.Bin416]|nr:MAG: hypothetical protein BWY72_02091 [Bacteroidetes bacterium ADurb.Bin416]
MALATISLGANEPRLSYFCMKGTPSLVFNTAPYPRNASVIKKEGRSTG